MDPFHVKILFLPCYNLPGKKRVNEILELYAENIHMIYFKLCYLHIYVCVKKERDKLNPFSSSFLRIVVARINISIPS